MKRGREKFAQYKWAINFLVKLCSLLPACTRKKMLAKSRYIQGDYGLVKRYILLKTLAVECGDSVAIYPDVYIMNPQHIKIGNNVSVHSMSYLEGGFEGTGITIGNDVSIAHGVTIMPTSHNYKALDIPIRDQKLSMSPVVIEDNVWIGAKATILSGATVKSGCVIGANSVVTHNTEGNGVYVGAPVKRIKTRE